MSRIARVFIILLTTTVCAAGFAAGGHLAGRSLAASQRNQNLGELAQLVLRRIEAAVDYAATALDDLSRRTGLDCSEALVLQELRFLVYERGPIKDIRIADRSGTVQCAAFSETLEFDRDWPDRADMMPSHDGALRLFRVETFSGTALGVLKDAGGDRAVIAILAADAALLDVMPSGLRQRSRVRVGLGDGEPVYSLSPGDGADALDDPARFEARSQRLPLVSEIVVDGTALAGWHDDLYVPLALAAGALGIAFGLLLARLLIRRDSPVAVLDRAIARREFVPWLQPVVDLATGEIVGCEVLARWQRGDGSVLPPSRFIPLAEASGRIQPLTWLLLSRALGELRPLLGRNKRFSVAINIAPSHFMTPGFVEAFRTLVGEYRVARRQVVVEITEREPFADLEAAAAAGAQLRSDGFRLAIDDVGVGHSGLSHLQRLGADVMKIDKFFVDSVDLDETARSIVELLVRLAGKLRMTVVAEGIETRSQAVILQASGVTRGQGYLYARPLPVPEFLALIAAREAGAPPLSVTDAA